MSCHHIILVLFAVKTAVFVFGTTMIDLFEYSKYIDAFDFEMTSTLPSFDTYFEKVDFFVRNGAWKVDYSDIYVEKPEMQNLMNLIDKGSKVTHLDLDRGSMESETMETLFLGLQRSNVEYLSMNDMNLFPEDLAALAKNMQKYPVPTLKYVSLNELYLEPENLKTLLVNGIGKAQVDLLDFHDNRFGNVGASLLASHLGHFQVKGLDLSRNEIRPDGIKDFLAAVPGSRLEFLDISSNPIGWVGWETLLNILPKSNLQEIRFGAVLNLDFASKLWESIDQTPKLRGLGLQLYGENYEDTVLGLKILSRMIRATNLSRLEVKLSVDRSFSNEISSSDIIEAVADSTVNSFTLIGGYLGPDNMLKLKDAKNLRYLDSYFDISEKSAVSAFASLVASSPIERLVIHGKWKLDLDDVQEIVRSCSVSKSLKTVVFPWFLGDSSKLLFKALGHLPALEILKYKYSNFK